MMDEILMEHQRRYPAMTVQDAVKLLYQREFGGGHLIADEAESLARIEAEYRELMAEEPAGGGDITDMADSAADSVAETAAETEAKTEADTLADTLAEAIGGGLYRVSLRILSKGLAPETLNRMFVLTAQEVQGSQEQFARTLDAWRDSVAESEAEAAAKYLADYQAQGCPMVSHSRAYRARYHPAYRIVAERFVRVLGICCEIDETLQEKADMAVEGQNQTNGQGRGKQGKSGGAVLVAIDGCSAGGKTTAAKTLGDIYDCNLFHMDDFFLRPEQRTPERYREPGGNVDYERFRSDVLTPLLAGEAFVYRIFDCGRLELTDSVAVTPRRLNIIEGAYSQHPYFGDIYDLKYWFFIAPEEQKRRILERNGAEMLKRFAGEWIPLEHAYFQSQGIDPVSGRPETR